MMSRTPVTLIGGYLGAGKTTLVNALLRDAGGRRLAVLVNDFGDFPIDADLIETREGNLLSISGGCICCSYGSDLIAAILALRAGDRSIDHLLIETSGVALPDPIVQSLRLVPDVTVDGVVGLADAETVVQRAGDRYVGDTVLAQLASSDVIVLNKIDLVSPQQVSTNCAWLNRIAPRARVLTAQYANLPADLILTRLGEWPGSRFQATGHNTARLASVSLKVSGAGDPAALARALGDPSLRLLRAKGIVCDREGIPTAIHVMGGRSSVEPAPVTTRAPGRLVCIGLADDIRAEAIAAAIAACPPFSSTKA